MTDKKVVTIQDISCFGKCSLTVALPIISAMGLSCAVIPTAVLSTHTGGFKGWTFRDLTDDIPAITEHWEKEGIAFDGISTGYLGSGRQVEMICDFFDKFGRNALKFVDPAMADFGKLYVGFDMDFVRTMKKLCSRADVVVPNITEASMLLETEYKERGSYDRNYVESLLRGLCALGAKKAIITGVSYDPSLQGAAAYDSETGEFREYFSENIPVSSHGTGDVFASACFGAYMLGADTYEAIKIAVDYTVATIRATVGDKTHWYGVKFEQCIPELTKAVAGLKK